MKKIIFLVCILLSFFAPAQNLPFSQRTDDWPRPLAGPENWNGQYTMPIGFGPLDFYYRFNWVDLQPWSGTGYDFSMFDQKINFAIDNGYGFSFCVMQYCGTCSQGASVGGAKSNYPLSVHSEEQKEAVKDYILGGQWQHNYNGVYIKLWAAFNRALNDHIMAGFYKGINYRDIINYIDVSGYGDYGEWTNNHPGTPQAGTSASLKAIIDATVQSYPTFQCVALFSVFDAMQLPGNTAIPADVGYYALTTSNQKGKLGWRRDSWGDPNWWGDKWSFANPTVYNGMNFGTEISNRYKIAPVVGEPLDLGSTNHYSDLLRQVKSSGTTSIGNGNFEGEATNSTAQNNFKAALKVAGARWTITAGNISGNAVNLTWINTGLTPLYGDWNINFKLKQNGVVKYIEKSKSVLKLATNFNSSDTLDAPYGIYDLYLYVEDPKNYRKPLTLGFSGQLSDGGYFIKQGMVISGTGPIPPDPVNCDTIIKVIRDSIYKVTHDTVVTVRKDSLVHRVCPSPVETVSIFTTQVPSVNPDNDQNGTGAEMGLKFRSSVSGFIKGVKFYKKTGMNGTHIGELYTKDGARLAQATFTGESSGGWQSLLFASPIAVNANTTYVVAVWYSDGNKLEQNNYFGSSVANKNLTALADGIDGENAPQNTKSVAPGFPKNYWKKGNYWIDVIFSNQ